MDLSGSSEVSSADLSVSVSDSPKKAKAKPAQSGVEAAKPAPAEAEAEPAPRVPVIYPLEVDHGRDALLTEFGKDTLRDRYLLPGETYPGSVRPRRLGLCRRRGARPALYDYISKLWFMPATPVLSNGGTGRGLPISCYLNSVADSLEGIVGTWNENVWLAAQAAAASAPIGAMSAASASRSASTARPAASSRSSG